jgi:hypothetical protein
VIDLLDSDTDDDDQPVVVEHPPSDHNLVPAALMMVQQRPPRRPSGQHVVVVVLSTQTKQPQSSIGCTIHPPLATALNHPLVETPSIKFDAGLDNIAVRANTATTTHQPQQQLLVELPWEDQHVPRKRHRPSEKPAPLRLQELADIDQGNDADDDSSCGVVLRRSSKWIQGTMELRSSPRSYGCFQNNNVNPDAANEPRRFEEDGRKRLPLSSSFDDIDERDNLCLTSPMIEYHESDWCLPLYTRMCLRLDRLIADHKKMFPSLDEDVRIATLQLFDNIEPDPETFQALVKLDQDARQRLVESPAFIVACKCIVISMAKYT